MTLIERINSFINAVASDIKSLYANKVNKTDVIAVAQGGTGAANVATARSNLGLGTAATAKHTENHEDSTVGRLLKVGDFGIGNNDGVLDLSEDWNNKQATSKYAGLTKYKAFYYAGGSNIGDYGYGSAIVQVLPDWIFGGKVLYGIGFGTIGDKEIYRINSTQNPTTKLFTENAYPLLDTGNSYKYNIAFKSLKSGQASYAKGWRKLTATLPSEAGEITEAHGVTTVETVQAKVTNSDGIIIYNNDIDPTNQFYVRVNGANLVLGVTANSTKVFGKTVTIYVGEEL